LLLVETRVDVRAPNDNEVVKHVVVESTLLFFVILTVTKTIFGLNCFDLVSELSLVLANHVDGGHKVDKLGLVVSIECSCNCPIKLYIILYDT
jgi:hypothetical protein